MWEKVCISASYIMQLSDQQVEYVWEQTCVRLKNELSEAVYNTWISTNPATQIADEESVATVQITCPTAFHAANLERNLNTIIINALEQSLDKKVKVVYQVGAATPRPTKVTKPITQVPDQQLSDNSLFSESVIQESEQQRTQWKAHQIGLNPQFSFTTFAVSSSNEMAYAAATSVAKNPGEAYNPLFLYGEVGVGKTHLMHAIGNEILLNQPNTNIIYCTGEDFTNGIVQAIQTKKASGFKFKYRSAQVLLLDDIQFIAGKNAVQEEFFHTFNSLIKQNAQIILTSDRPPSEISLLEKRLQSRFEAGLMIDIGRPTFELRTAILLLKAKQAQLNLSVELAKTIAEKILSAREIEGFITRLRSEVELKKRTIDQDLVTQLVTHLTKKQKKISINPNQAINIVARHYGLKPLELRGQSRVKHLIKPRHLIMYIMNKDLELPLTEIGRWFSHRDHTSILHGVRKTQQEILDNQDSQKELIVVRALLQRGA